MLKGTTKTITMDQWLQRQQQPLDVRDLMGGVYLHPQQLRQRGTLQIGGTGGGRDVEGSEKSKGSDGEAQGAKASPSRPRNRKSDAEKRTMLVPAPNVGNSEISPEDSFTWRKYGQKELLGSKYPRSYYRCTHQKLYGCPAKKQVQRLDHSPNIIEVTYRGEHTCRMSLTAPSSFPPPPPQPLVDISKDMAQSTTTTQLSPSSTSVSSCLQSSMNLSLCSGGGGSGGDSGGDSGVGGAGTSTSKYGADFPNTELENSEFPKTEVKPLDSVDFLKNELHEFPKTELEAGDFRNTELEDSECPKMEVNPLDFPKRESHEFPKTDIFGQGLIEPPDTDGWQNAIRIELSDNKLSELPLFPYCMELKVLMLQRNVELTKIPSSFFLHMPLLQIMDLSYTSVRELPHSFFFLEQLRELYLKGCECFMKLPPEIGNLQKLEKLDLDETQITHLPQEVQKLTKMQSLTLYFYEYRGKKNKPYSYSTIIPSGVLSKLKRLKHLSIGVNPDDERWHDNVQVILPEILGLELLETLSIYIPQLELLKLIPAYILEEVDFRFIVGRHMQRIISSILPAIDVKFKQSDRSLKFVKGKDVPVEIKKLLRHSKALFLDRHVTIKSLSEFQMKNLEELRVCILAECKEMETIVGGGDSNGNCDMLSHLLYLSVSHMKNLRSIWEGPTVPRFLFGLLQSLSLQSCPKLMTLFSLDFLGNLSLLKELIVKDCPKLTTLINRESSMHSAYDFLPKLRKLSLLHLPKLTSIWNRLHIGRGLKEIAFYDCPKLCSLSRKELASDALMAIKGETNWWNALKGRPSEFDRIFIPIHQEADVITQLGIYNDDDIDNCPGGPMGKPSQPRDVATPVLNSPALIRKDRMDIEQSSEGPGCVCGREKEGFEFLLKGLDMEERYEPLKDLGSGNFGVARLAKDRKTGELVAVKYIERGNKIDENVQREIINHRSLRHPNIIRFKEVLLTPTHLAIVLEYASGGELFERICNAGRFSEDEARNFFQQLISGVSYCHSMDICHRDLKLENTLLDGNPSPRLKICDFGYSKSALLDTQPKSTVGTPAYIAPEALLKMEYDGKIADVWSCGVTLYAMLVGAYPFEDPEDPRNFRKTVMSILGVQYSIPDCVRVSAECRNILSCIFVANPAKRITIPEIKQNPWFLKNLPREIIEAERKGSEETQKDQPSQSVEEIMRIIQEARKPGPRSKAGDGWQAGTGSLDVEDDDEVDVSGDYERVIKVF